MIAPVARRVDRSRLLFRPSGPAQDDEPGRAPVRVHARFTGRLPLRTPRAHGVWAVTSEVKQARTLIGLQASWSVVRGAPEAGPKLAALQLQV